jgi:hypothetical protein
MLLFSNGIIHTVDPSLPNPEAVLISYAGRSVAQRISTAPDGNARDSIRRRLRRSPSANSFLPLPATAAAVGLAQMHGDEPHVFVRGRMAGYRIHLATEVIYLESGQYHCIVSSPKRRKAIYLRFEDGGEPISGELVSKVLLLANDTAITDGSILAQIVPLRQAA